MRPKYDKSSIEGKIYRLILSLFLPMLAVAFFILVMLITANLQYASISGNISKASGFSQDFKSDVDLKMYYYVTGSREELPLEEAISLYEQGVKLHAQLEGTLAAQQKRIERIDPETAEIEAFEGNEHDVS